MLHVLCMLNNFACLQYIISCVFNSLVVELITIDIKSNVFFFFQIPLFKFSKTKRDLGLGHFIIGRIMEVIIM